MAINQFNKEIIKRELKQRNDKAREVFKHKMCRLFGEDLYKENVKHLGRFNRKWDN